MNLYFSAYYLQSTAKLGFSGETAGKEPTCQCRRCKRVVQVWTLGQEDLLEEGMATHCSILAWRIPGTKEPDGLQSMGLQSQARLKWFSMHHTQLNYNPEHWKESSRKTSTFALLTMPKPLTLWITTNCRKFLNRWKYQAILPASWKICMQVKEQQTGSK